MRRSLLAAVVALAGVGASPAAAQIPPPSLTADTTFAFSGVSEYDYRAALADDIGRRAAVDPALGRSYAVGDTETVTGETVIAVVARRADGALDPGFAGDGSLALPVTAGQDAHGADIAVLPDGRLRILGTADVDATSGTDLDVVLAGLLADGTPDPDFDVETFPAGGGDDVAGGLAIDTAGRLAISGGTGDDTFLAVRSVDGSPDGPITILDRGVGRDDTGVDVALGAAGPVALIEIDGLLGTRSELYELGGFDTELAVPGATDVAAGGLLAYGGKLWATGTATVGADDDIYVARVDSGGADLQTRRFDIRGSIFSPSQPVAGHGADLTLVAGDPDTLVVGGSSTTDAGEEWALAAFNGLEGPLDALQVAELVIPVAGQGGASGVAGAPGGVVAGAGTLRDFAPGAGGTGDLSISMARAFIDVEKRCDVSLAITSPVELVLRGTQPGALAIRVTNNGKRTCASRLSLPAPWSAAAGTLDLGRIVPGETVSRTLSLSYGAAFPATGTLELTLVAGGDAALGDNVVRLPVVFSFCDLQLALAEAPLVLGTEGERRFSFTLRNVGTAPCRSAQVLTGATGRRVGLAVPFPVAPGRSVEDAFSVGVARGTKSGRAAALSFGAADADDVNAANNGATSAPMVVRPGDTTTRKPTRAGTFTGSASAGSGKGVPKRTLRVRYVQISVQRSGKECVFLGSARGELRTLDKGDSGKCDEPVWVKVSGTEKWKLRLRKALPKGLYTLRSRAVLANGVAEGRFTRGDKNLVRFRLR
jgi:hypothetical protein